LRNSDSQIEIGDSKPNISIAILNIGVAEFEAFDSERAMIATSTG
jgi:hypothetical protein